MVSINQQDVRGLQIPLAPLDQQKKFLDSVDQYAVVASRLDSSSAEVIPLFDGLLSRALGGELTAEWEAANSEWIAEQQSFHERLPRLMLALLAEKVKHASHAAAEVLITALMKYAFLFQMEGNGRLLYRFVPYHFGPFAKELYADLEKLQSEGLVRVENDAEEDKTRITLTDLAKTERVLSDLPEDLKKDVASIVETYGNLDHNRLLRFVYEKYPAYARKSRLKHARRAVHTN